MRNVILIITIALISCQAKNQEKQMALAVASNVPIKEANATDNPVSQLIIKNANYKFQVERVDSATKKIESIVRMHNAMIADMNQETTSRDISNTFTIRVPSDHFERLLENLSRNAIFTNYKRITTEDVTEEFVDIETRLRTKKAVRDRYIDILKNKAKTVEDVLKAEDQIRTLQEEIEAKEGRLRYLQSRVSMSTINLEIYQRVDYQEIPGTYEKPYSAEVKQAFSNGWEIVTSSALFFVNIWPLVIIGGIFFWRRKWLKEKLTRKQVTTR